MRLAVLAVVATALSLPLFAEEPDEATKGHIQRLQELRGLKFKKDPTVKFWDEEKLKKMMIDDFEEELPDSKAAEISLVLEKFGLLPKGYDLKKEYLALMVEQIAGFYHPKTKLLCLIEGKSGTGIEQEVVIIHELDHAMQDQHYDLTRLQKLVEKNDDMAQAFKCLVEGEATYIMMEHMIQSQGGMSLEQVPGIEALMEGQMRSSDPRAAKLNEAPLFIKEGLLRPYLDGFKWCLAVKKSGGWDKLNGAWADLPVSTEQILHPEKYLTRDMPQTVKLPKLKSKLEGWDKVEDNTMGEFGVLMVFHTLKPKSKTSGREAAEGWDGDTYRIYQKGEETMLAWATVWDTENDASEFAIAYTKILRSKYPEVKEVKADGKSFSRGTSKGEVRLSVKGTKVYIVEGGSAQEAEAVATAMEEECEFKEMKGGVGAPK